MQDDKIVGQVNKVNAEFYHAFETLSIGMMCCVERHVKVTFYL